MAKGRTHQDFDFYAIEVQSILAGKGVEIDLDDSDVEESYLMPAFEAGFSEEECAQQYIDGVR